MTIQSKYKLLEHALTWSKLYCVIIHQKCHTYCDVWDVMVVWVVCDSEGPRGWSSYEGAQH